MASLNPLILDASYAPYSLDPAVDFSFPAWAAMQQVYQTLVLYNQSSSTTYYGILSDRWSISPDRLTYTFHLRSGIHFSNGDPLTAYAMWFSLYRTLATNGSPQFILSQNFWYPGVTYYSPSSLQNNAYSYMVNALNTWNFEAPNAAQLAGMEAANQSFQVVDAQTIALHLGNGYLGVMPYTYLLATLATPVASAVDPAVVQAQGGVGGTNMWMASHMLGTGPYFLATYSAGSSYLLAPDPNYWGAAASARESWNAGLRPARSAILVRPQPNPILQVQDLESGAVAGVDSYLTDAIHFNELTIDPCVVTKTMDPVYGSVLGGWWVFMDQAIPPLSNLSVRQAIAHAINYDQIIQVAFGGYAHRWVGPVPPGYPYYNPQGVAPYDFNLALARQSMNESPWPNGYPNTLNYAYLQQGPWPTVALLIQADLAQIGINVHPVGITLDNLYTIGSQDATGVCISETSYAGGPFYIGQEFWTADYLAPDDWTQSDALSYGPANQCLSHYSSAAMDALVLEAAGQDNQATLAQDYSQMTQMMYANVTNAWLFVPDQFQAYHPSLRGLVPNPMGEAADFAMTLNTLSAVAPLAAQASAATGETGQPTSLRAITSGGTAPFTYAWQFGDGTNASGPDANVTHVYAVPGNYTANVTVRDSYGGYATASVSVLVVSRRVPPAISIGWVVYVAVRVTLAAAAVAVIFIWHRRHRPREPAQAPSLGPPPAPPPP